MGAEAQMAGLITELAPEHSLRSKYKGRTGCKDDTVLIQGPAEVTPDRVCDCPTRGAGNVHIPPAMSHPVPECGVSQNYMRMILL